MIGIEIHVPSTRFSSQMLPPIAAPKMTKSRIRGSMTRKVPAKEETSNEAFASTGPAHP